MSYDLMFQKAIELQNNGALNEAEAIYLKMLEAMPENSDVWNLLGLVAQSKGNAGRAADCFLSAIRYAPTPFAPHFFNLGLTYRMLGKKREALEALRRAADLQPDLKEAWNYLGLTQEETGDHQEAVKSFCQALDIDGAYNEARANLCFYTNDKETLLQLADEQESDFQANLLAAESCGELTEREHYLRRATAANPYHTGGLLALAEARRAAGDETEALQLYHKVLNLDENATEALLGAADIYLARGDLERAELYYKKSFDITRDIAGAHLNYGTLLYRSGRKSDALEEYRTAAVLEPEKPEISYNLALVLKDLGDYEEALGLMFNAHQRAPEREDFSAGIMETLTGLATENAELALKIAENWQKIEPDNVFSRRILAGISGMLTESGDDRLYAEKLFDNFAATYDETLERLNPQITVEFLRRHGAAAGNVLDLGCGTGLAAQALKTADNTFDGADVSANMLEAARCKGLYRELYQADAATLLREMAERATAGRAKEPAEEPEAAGILARTATKVPTGRTEANTAVPHNDYDLILAFDVFCYMGNLEEILTAAADLMRRTDRRRAESGKTEAARAMPELWFTTESADEERGNDFYLTAAGRYKHRRQYVEKALQKAGFTEIDAYPLTLRQENGADVPGVLFRAANPGKGGN